MVYRKENAAANVRDMVRGGPGKTVELHYLKKEELPQNCGNFGPVILEKDCGIGSHTHHHDSEIYYIMQGEAIYSDNGGECILRAGDLALVKRGDYHAIRNEKEETLIFIAAGWDSKS